MPRGVYVHKRGYKRAPYSDEWRQRLSSSLRGRAVWNKGIKTGPNPEHSERMKGKPSWNKGKKTGPLSPEHRAKIAAANVINGNKPPSCKGKKRGPEAMANWLAAVRGKPRPHKRGENSGTWKGGVTARNAQIRTSIEYKNWRREVFSRDDYSCVSCGHRGGSMEADHIKPFCAFPELRFDASNGRTLCRPCHKQTDTFGVKARWLN
jgi:hypothetical protein